MSPLYTKRYWQRSFAALLLTVRKNKPAQISQTTYNATQIFPVGIYISSPDRLVFFLFYKMSDLLVDLIQSENRKEIRSLKLPDIPMSRFLTEIQMGTFSSRYLPLVLVKRTMFLLPLIDDQSD